MTAVNPHTRLGPAVNAGSFPRGPKSSVARKEGSNSSLMESVKTLSTCVSYCSTSGASEHNEYALKNLSQVEVLLRVHSSFGY